MRLLRWAVLAPATIVAGIVVAVTLAALIGPSQETWQSQSAPWVAGFNTAAVSVAALLVAQAIAPSGKPWAVAVVAVLLIVLNALELSSVLREIGAGATAPKERVRIGEVIGFFTVAITGFAIAVRQIKTNRKVPPNSTLQPTPTRAA